MHLGTMFTIKFGINCFNCGRFWGFGFTAFSSIRNQLLFLSFAGYVPSSLLSILHSLPRFEPYRDCCLIPRFCVFPNLSTYSFVLIEVEAENYDYISNQSIVFASSLQTSNTRRPDLYRFFIFFFASSY